MSSGLYRIVSFDRQMAGAAGSWQTTIGAVAKPNSQNAPYCIPNELICSELGRFLRLPLPPAGIIYAPNAPTKFWFASLDFNLTGNSLPPIDPTQCASALPDLSTGLLLFDVLIGNSDRHTMNLSVDFSKNPPELSVFDHSHALFGSTADQGESRLATIYDHLGIGSHCLLNRIASDSYFGKWLERIEKLPNFTIEEVVGQAEHYGISSTEAAKAVDFLKHRRDRMKEIIAHHKAEFKGITQWSLL